MNPDNMTNDELLADLPVGERVEVAPGVTVERRCFLKTAAMGAAALALPSLGTEVAKPTEDPRISFPAFLATVNKEAKQRIAAIDKTGEDHYLYWLASHAVRLADVAKPEKVKTFASDSVRGSIGVNPGAEGFVVLQWQLEPGSRIRPHPHDYANVVTVGLEGEAMLENWEMVGERDLTLGQQFRFRRTNRQLLRPHGINVVPLSHGYVHGFRAGPKGVRFLDITTQIKPPTKTIYLRLDPEPVDATRQEYTGYWFSDD